MTEKDLLWLKTLCQTSRSALLRACGVTFCSVGLKIMHAAKEDRRIPAIVVCVCAERGRGGKRGTEEEALFGVWSE